MEINKPSVSASGVRGRKRFRSASKDEGPPGKRGRRNLYVQGRICPSTSSTKTQKGPLKVEWHSILDVPLSFAQGKLQPPHDGWNNNVSESKVRGRKRSHSSSKDEGCPGKRKRKTNLVEVPSGCNESKAGSGTGGGLTDIRELCTHLRNEISQQLMRREAQSAASDDAGCSTSSPKSTSCNSKVRLEDLYCKGELIGIGGFGKVYAGIRRKDGLRVAIKEVYKDGSDEVDMPALEGEMPTEVVLMKLLSTPPACPYIVKFIEWFDGPTKYAIVMERPEPCQNLFHFCIESGGYLSEELAQLVLLQLLLALFHCEDRGVLHGDIAATNLLIQTDSLQVKLIDFGCGSLQKNSSKPEYLGTALRQPLRFAPHLDPEYTVMCIAALILYLVCATVPYHNQETGSLYIIREVSKEFQDLMNWCLSLNQITRPTLEQIASHPWLQKDWQSVLGKT